MMSSPPSPASYEAGRKSAGYEGCGRDGEKLFSVCFPLSRIVHLCMYFNSVVVGGDRCRKRPIGRNHAGFHMVQLQCYKRNEHPKRHSDDTWRLETQYSLKRRIFPKIRLNSEISGDGGQKTGPQSLEVFVRTLLPSVSLVFQPFLSTGNRMFCYHRQYSKGTYIIYISGLVLFTNALIGLSSYLCLRVRFLYITPLLQIRDHPDPPSQPKLSAHTSSSWSSSLACPAYP